MKNDLTPIREENGYYIQIAGTKLNLFIFDKRRAQNHNGTGYNVFDGLKLKFSGNREELISHMEKNEIKITKECSIVNLPTQLIK